MTEKSWKKRTAIAGIAALLIVSGNLPINLVAEDTDNPAPDTTETITEENTAPETSDSETDSEDNTNTETTVSTEETDSSLDQSSADESEAQKTNTLAGTSSDEEDQAAATGIQIQYDGSTTIHYVKDGNDTLILYCMNNGLHWPHKTPTISDVPTYSETTLSEFLGANDVEYSPDLELQLKSLLYAGYPYNGFGQYQIVDSSVKEVTEEEFDALLDAPQYLREDFPNSLGETVFTLKN